MRSSSPPPPAATAATAVATATRDRIRACIDVYSWRLAFLYAVYNVQFDYDHFILYFLFAESAYGCDYDRAFGVFLTLRAVAQVVRKAISGAVADYAAARVHWLLNTCVAAGLLVQLLLLLLPTTMKDVLVLQLILGTLNTQARAAIYKLVKLHLNQRFPAQPQQQAFVINSLQAWGEGLSTVALAITLGIAYLYAIASAPFAFVRSLVFAVSIAFTIVTLLLSLSIRAAFIAQPRHRPLHGGGVIVDLSRMETPADDAVAPSSLLSLSPTRADRNNGSSGSSTTTTSGTNVGSDTADSESATAAAAAAAAAVAAATASNRRRDAYSYSYARPGGYGSRSRSGSRSGGAVAIVKQCGHDIVVYVRRGVLAITTNPLLRWPFFIMVALWFVQYTVYTTITIAEANSSRHATSALPPPPSPPLLVDAAAAMAAVMASLRGSPPPAPPPPPTAVVVATPSSRGTTTTFCDGRLSNLLIQGVVLNVVYALGSILYGTLIAPLQPSTFFSRILPTACVVLAAAHFVLLAPIGVVGSAWLLAGFNYATWAAFNYARNVGVAAVRAELVGFYVAAVGVAAALVQLVPSVLVVV
eukprot:CAMPEP_0198365452 /NCGR_PEP_ID=MMETSP1450-20131203/154181_1 /TAXON_ID=753684 ORGANISM="Madagascaria erythrocladiodes, Strain CCMP3234" /NCGR_SAMPLE_ID=MMETSP1450 /ASSEMBLY_ACC=CAM_ASM_001115 /LENGTH=585 /DNA_ID=CAMNT_0044072903 /DNA_START=39 /DNA_END=1796 /DNA_ORIENTATION=+